MAPCTLCEKIGLKPFTKENVFYYYIPIHGLASYGALSLNVMNPSLVSKILSPRKDLTNALLLSSVCIFSNLRFNWAWHVKCKHIYTLHIELDRGSCFLHIWTAIIEGSAQWKAWSLCHVGRKFVGYG